jgi:glutathione-independent formaldehyde dehydrogenase
MYWGSLHHEIIHQIRGGQAMKAVVFKDTREVVVDEVPDPKIEEATDAIVNVTSSCICGTDLHMYDGRTGATPGLLLGHEPLGVVAEVGKAVELVKPGDRVVIPTHLFCGLCFNCVRGYSAACLRVRPGSFGAAYGYAGMGPYRGALAPLLRVPYADANCVLLPGQPGDEHEDDFVLLADAFVTGWHATELCDVTAGTSVAIWGSGAIGLLAAYSSMLKGAGEVYVIDHIPERLAKAEEIGATPINFEAGDPVEQVKELRKSRFGRTSPWCAAPMDGVMCAIDAVGFQAHDEKHSSQERPTQVPEDIARLINPTGRVAIAGVYTEKDLTPAPEGAANGELKVHWATFFNKGVPVGFGRTNDRRYTTRLRDLIIAGRAHPGTIVSHHASLEEAPGLFRAFDQRADGVIKVVVNPN